MKSIRVTFAVRAGRPALEPGARAATDQSDSERRDRAARDSAVVFGMEITGVSFADDLVRFQLSGTHCLEVFPAGIHVGWRILAAPESNESSGLGAAGEEAILLELVTSSRSSAPQRWNRKAFLEARIGRRITRLYASDTPLLLFVEGIRESLYFLPLWKLPDGPPMLHWTDVL